MNKRPLLEYIEIPNDYSDFVEFIDKNYDLIISDTQLLLRIINELNTRLSGFNNTSELHNDSSMVLRTIRIQHEALNKEYQHQLGVEKLIEWVNDGVCDEYYETCKSKFMRAKFVDQLDFEYLPKEHTQRAPKKYDDYCTQPANIPNILETVKEDCQETQAIINIKKRISKYQRIEYFTFILDPNSFSRTIYNAFNLALAIRTKVVSLVEHDGAIFVTKFQAGTVAGGVNHSVLELTWDTYKRLLAKINFAGENGDN